MNNATLFKFKDHDVRTVQLDGEPWFAGADMLGVLFGKAAGNGWAYAMLSPEERTKVDRTYLGLRPGKQMVVVSESGLYKLVMRSDKPEAKEFQNWVTKVVLPAISKDGGYIHGEEHVVSGAMTEDEPKISSGPRIPSTGATISAPMVSRRGWGVEILEVWVRPLSAR